MNTLFSRIIRVVNYLIPKDNKSIYFRSTFLYPDNIDAVIEALIEKTSDTYTIYVEEPNFRYNSPNIKKVQNRLSSLFHYCRSKYIFWDTGMFGNPRPVKSQITINLWHGVSFKKIGFYLTSIENSYPTSTYVVTYSDLFAEKMAVAFGVNKSNVLTTGEPRNDYLFSPVSDDELISLGINIAANKKIVFWMPTYRQSKFENKSDGSQYDFGFPFLNESNIAYINNVCEQNNLILVLKWHALQRLPKSINSDELNNLVFLTSENLAEKGIGLYRVLARSHALITDYSSVFINYLLLDRPICFAYDDIDYYRDNRGFMFDDIEAYMPGMKAQTIEGLVKFLNDVAEGNDNYIEVRHKMKSTFNRYYDGNNAERLLYQLGIVNELRVK